jgi:LytR cell envelope-related transcriptional attenuator
VNPGIARLAIVLALVVGGVAVLASGFSDGESAAAPPTSPSPSASPSPTPSPAPDPDVVPNQEGVLVQVLNGTSTPGLAGDFQILLDDEGYVRAGEPADAPQKPVVDTIVYFRRDRNAEQNRADAQLLSETYLGGVPVQPLPADLADPDVTSESADVVVVLGEDQAGEA